ncbi:hypothetical protein MNBD_NITROSPINAE01-1227 [hydrothermal vent metagenome]|uniref:Lipoprotein n=1 Tax=hydrothermal vent metagenome TaxID=652676 RepID=A0A3B1C1L7_9ZZZZ
MKLKKSHLTLTAFLFAGLIWGVAGCSKEMDTSFIQRDSFSNAKSLYSPTDNEIVADEDTGLEVIKNVINVIFAPETDKDTINKAISFVQGEVVGYNKAVYLYQVRVKVANLKELDEISKKLLGKFKEVELVSKCSVSVHKNPYYVR